MDYYDILLARKLNGGGGGGGDVDLPIFDIVYDMEWNSTVTCNETFAQCWARWHSADVGSYVRTYYEDGQSYQYDVASAINGQENDYLTYVISGSSGAMVDIVYHANGTISVTEPSAYTTELSATHNGYYSPQMGTYSSVNVNVGGVCVYGTFTTGSTGETQETLSIPYEGDGYPRALLIWQKINSSVMPTGSIYGVDVYYMIKCQFQVPTYMTSGGVNKGGVTILYYNSDAGNETAVIGPSQPVYTQNYSATASAGCAIFDGNGKTIKYYVGGGTASTIGFVKNTEYRYAVIYSK